MKKLFIFAAAICAFFFVAPSSMFAESKNALLIANASYSTAPLSTPIQESRGLKKTLEKLGFAVTIVENGGREKMLDALDDFGRLLKNKGGVGFFHYGGHAVQFNGKNYLIPVDADISDERRVSTRAVDLDDVISSVDEEKNVIAFNNNSIYVTFQPERQLICLVSYVVPEKNLDKAECVDIANGWNQKQIFLIMCYDEDAFRAEYYLSYAGGVHADNLNASLDYYFRLLVKFAGALKDYCAP